jgi:hypothetical protein
MSTLRAFIIYKEINNRQFVENSQTESPKSGLLFLDPTDVYQLFGETPRGQVITRWKNCFEKSLSKDQRYRDFYKYAKSVPAHFNEVYVRIGKI